MKKLLLFLVILWCVSTFALDLEDVQNAIDNAGANWTAGNKPNWTNCGLIPTYYQNEETDNEKDLNEESLNNKNTFATTNFITIWNIDIPLYIQKTKYIGGKPYTYQDINENYKSFPDQDSSEHKRYYIKDKDNYNQLKQQTCYAFATAELATILSINPKIDMTLLNTLINCGNAKEGGSVEECLNKLIELSNESKIKVNEDEIKITEIYKKDPSHKNWIKQQIGYEGTPVVLQMEVFEDFLYYKSGVYKHVTGNHVGYHSVVIVGYNDEYNAFLVKNSWGKDWGENGYCWIDYDQLDETLTRYTDSNGQKYTMPVYSIKWTLKRPEAPEDWFNEFDAKWDVL